MIAKFFFIQNKTLTYEARCNGDKLFKRQGKINKYVDRSCRRCVSLSKLYTSFVFAPFGTL